MNTQERRQLVRGQTIDVAVAKVAINKSRRQRVEATKTLSKQMAASRFDSSKTETISYPQAG